MTDEINKLIERYREIVGYKSANVYTCDKDDYIPWFSRELILSKGDLYFCNCRSGHEFIIEGPDYAQCVNKLNELVEKVSKYQIWVDEYNGLKVGDLVLRGGKGYYKIDKIQRRIFGINHSATWYDKVVHEEGEDYSPLVYHHQVYGQFGKPMKGKSDVYDFAFFKKCEKEDIISIIDRLNNIIITESL